MVAVLKAGAAAVLGCGSALTEASWMSMHSKCGFTGMANERTREKAPLLSDVMLKLEGGQA